MHGKDGFRPVLSSVLSIVSQTKQTSQGKGNAASSTQDMNDQSNESSVKRSGHLIVRERKILPLGDHMIPIPHGMDMLPRS